ncbi:hypothetical protein Pfo_025458 [Paulownia fortunei]|nr:hypothetical protein Pfo_025458 [Paulownia fortunei]
MALEAFLDSNSQLPIPLILPVNGAGGILEALSSHNSLKNEEHLDSILSMAQLNTNLVSDVINLTILGKSSTSRSAAGHDATVAVANLTHPTGAYLQSHGNTNMEPYMSLPSSPMSFSNNNPVNVFSSSDTLFHLCQGGQKERKNQQLGNTKGSTDLYKTKLQTRQDSLPVRIKQEPSTLTPILKKPRLDVNQENIHHHQQEISQELLLKELQDCNPQLTAMIKQYRQQTQLQPPILHSAPQLRGFHLQLPKQQMGSLLQDQGNQQVTFAPLLDGGICSRRFKQYLYHLRNNIHDNGIAYWKKFVSEYYAPGSKKRWCFSKYENIELHTTGVFSPKSMETWGCHICGSRSGKGLEATFDIFPRLFKIKFESGMLDEILFLDSPRACKISSGLVLEYRKAIQESVYEKFRVVHEGKLRIVFRHDLKILSWEFCAQNHEEFLLRSLITPQVNQLVQAAKKYQNDTQNGASFRVSSEDLQTICDMFVSAADQLLKNMELPLVNDLGYPKRFIRCLQIAEVVDSMKDLMAFSHNTKLGPIECLNNYSQGSKTGNQMKEKQGMKLFVGAQNLPTFPEQQPGSGCHANGCTMTPNGVMSGSGNSGLAFINLNHQLLGQNSSTASVRRKGQESCLMDHSNQAIGFAQSFDSHLHNEAPPYSLPRSQSSTHGKNPHQALVDKLLHEMVAASRGKSVQDTYGKLNNEAAHKSNQKCVTGNELHYGESSNAAAAQANLANASRTANFSKAASHGNLPAVSQNITVKAEPYSPEKLPEAFQSSASGFSKIEDLDW